MDVWPHMRRHLWRNVMMMILIGAFVILVDRVWEGEWPSYSDSVIGWAGLIAGYLAIALLFTWLQARYELRDETRADS